MKELLRAAVVLVASILVAQLTPGQDFGPKIMPAAMSIDYNPLLWRGDDASFALDTIYGSRCEAELSKAVFSKSSNPNVQELAQTLGREEHRVYGRLRRMARTFNFHVPKQDPDSCQEASRLAELTGQELDAGYVAFLLKRSLSSISRFEAEIGKPVAPDNYSLRKFAQKTLPVLQEQKMMLEAEQRKLASK